MIGLPVEREDCIFPPSPDIAGLVAMLFLRFGGALHIDQNGKRQIVVPEPCLFRMEGKEMPSLPHARLHEQFHYPDEFRGAMKLITGLLYRLDPTDKAFVFDAFASVYTPIEAEHAKARSAGDGNQLKPGPSSGDSC